MAVIDGQSPPAEVVSQLVKAALKDPGLPRKSPTEAFWQLPLHPQVANKQSKNLPARTDFAVIGSGVTGCSVTKTLLENLSPSSHAHIAVLEARSLTSGATGRNGGHLVSPIPGHFTHFEHVFGREQAIKIARFCNRTLESMHKLGEQDEVIQRTAETRRVRSACGFRDESTLMAVQDAIKHYEQALPECRGDCQIIDSVEAEEKFNLKDVVGAEVQSAGAFWPYRLVTSTFDRLLRQYPCQLAIETHTPVEEIGYDAESDTQYPYILTTPRGVIRAARVLHCTNGWTGHLLPSLRGKIWPLRGTMSVQAPTADLPRVGDQLSWSMIDRSRYDPTDQSFAIGLYYVTQNANTGDVFVGGEHVKVTELISSDDTCVSELSQQKLRAVLPTLFAKGWAASESPEIRKLWSGIMGFTSDGIPWVGKLPRDVHGRDGDQEWVVAGFNGYGMPLCWGCGEAVAKQVLGIDCSSWFPEAFLISPDRLSSPQTAVEAGITGLLA